MSYVTILLLLVICEFAEGCEVRCETVLVNINIYMFSINNHLSSANDKSPNFSRFTFCFMLLFVMIFATFQPS